MELLCGIFQQPCMVVFRPWSVCRVTSPSVGHTHTSFWVLGGEESKETKTAGWAKTEITLYVVPILLHLSDLMNVESWIVKYELICCILVSRWRCFFLFLRLGGIGLEKAGQVVGPNGVQVLHQCDCYKLQPEGNSIFFIAGTDGERLVQIKQKIQINWNWYLIKKQLI